jgi:DNA-binding protein Fis
LPSERELSGVRRLEMALSRPFPEDGMDFEDLLGNVERELIEKAMREADGNQSAAARLLRLNRDKIRYRLKNPETEKE